MVNVNRRRMMAGLAAAGLTPWFPAPALSQVDPATSLAIANTALSTMRSFSSAGNGLQAMLEAQNAKLDLIIKQLGEIQTDIVKLQIKIDDLPAEFQGLLRQQYRDELITGLGGAAVRYASLMRAYEYDRSVLRQPQSINELTFILNTATQQRSTLTLAEGGVGPEAALILPLALALEVASQGRLDFMRARTLATLDDYDAWTLRMLSEEPGAIWPAIREAKQKHDALIDTLAGQPIGRATGIAKAKMGSAQQPDGRFRDPCSLVCEMNVEQNVFDVTGKNEDIVRAVCGRGWGIERIIGYRDDTQFGVRMLSYDIKSEGLIVPIEGDICSWRRAVGVSEVNNLPAAQVKALAAPNMGKFDNRRIQFLASLDRLNYYRARAGYCARALQIVEQVRTRVTEYRGMLTA